MTTETTLTPTMSMRRNLNPHAEAILAMILWGDAYSKQKGGSMDFWDDRSEYQKRLCRETVDHILKAKRAE